MRAVLVFHDKQVLTGGAIVEMKIFQVATPVLGSAHKLKYSLYYGIGDQRLVGYDNERGKGDHRHVAGEEEPYAFESLDQLLTDFQNDIENWSTT